MSPDNAGKTHPAFVIFLQRKRIGGKWDEEDCVPGIGFADAGGSVRGGGCGDDYSARQWIYGCTFCKWLLRILH